MDDLEAAQSRMLDMLLEQLQPLEGKSRLLIIGGSYGGLAIRAAQRFGCYVKANVTNSLYASHAHAAIRRFGLEGQVECELVDDWCEWGRRHSHDRTYDHLYIGEDCALPSDATARCAFFEVVRGLISQGGTMVLQAITASSTTLLPPTTIESLAPVFPLSMYSPPSLSELLMAIGSVESFHLDRSMGLRMHYIETIQRWRAELNRHRGELYALGWGFDYMRLWNYSMCMREALLRESVINLQVLRFTLA